MGLDARGDHRAQPRRGRWRVGESTREGDFVSTRLNGEVGAVIAVRHQFWDVHKVVIGIDPGVVGVEGRRRRT